MCIDTNTKRNPVNVVCFLYSEKVITIGCIFFNALYFTSGGSAGEYVHSMTEIPYLFAVSQLPVVQVSVFNNVATLITILSGMLILSEPFHYYHVIGAVVIIFGVILVNAKKKPSRSVAVRGGFKLQSPGNLGGFGANHHLRQTLTCLNMPVVQNPEAYISGSAKLLGEDRKINNEGTIQFLQTFVDAFVELIKKY